MYLFSLFWILRKFLIFFLFCQQDLRLQVPDVFSLLPILLHILLPEFAEVDIIAKFLNCIRSLI